MRRGGLLAATVLLSGGVAVAQGNRLLMFDVASVRQNTGDDLRVSSNVPLGPGRIYVPTGGVLNARNFALIVYIAFAYRMTDQQLESVKKQAPAWVLTDRFDIEAKTDRADVTKDELRLMMRELLAERFGLKLHSESRETAVYELLPVTPGLLGPSMRVHPTGMECAGGSLEVKGGAPETVPGGYPTFCGGITGMIAEGKGMYRIGASKIGVKLMADSFESWGGLGRPVVDRTGLMGEYDFVLEFAPLRAPDEDAEISGPTFREALRKQLGLKLEAGRAMVEFLVMDRVERLNEN